MALVKTRKTRRNPLSLDMGWKTLESISDEAGIGRNPLSLDMGWKVEQIRGGATCKAVAIRFRWIWVGSKPNRLVSFTKRSRNPLSLDMGWKPQLL